MDEKERILKFIEGLNALARELGIVMCAGDDMYLVDRRAEPSKSGSYPTIVDNVWFDGVEYDWN